jgi:CubicO group peptidase (beta-lactamase class C family)
MKKYLLLITALTATCLLHAQPPTDARLKGLDTLAQKILKSWHAPGVAIAIVEKNKIVYTGGFGYRDVEKKLPVTENTLFAIGSCTKAFTATLLGILEKDEKVDLDKPVRNYLPELTFFNEYTAAHATLRDMMSHRTGLPRHDLSWYGATASRQELLKRIEFLEPTAELREKWQYNNFMFMAQGMVVEKLTGQSWEKNLAEKLLQPLNMPQTVMTVTDMEKNPDHSLAYSVIKDSLVKVIPYRNIDAIGAAGSINSSAKEMANWLIAWINRGSFQGREIFPAAFAGQAMTVQMTTGGGLPSPENPDIHLSGYGLGWGMASYRGHYRVEHGGGIDGFISSTGFFPSDSIGIFVVSCRSEVTTAVRNAIADRMLRLTPRDWNGQLLREAAKNRLASVGVKPADSLGRKPGTTPSHPLQEYTGSYRHPGYGVMMIRLQQDSLYAAFNAFNMKLRHYHYDRFEALLADEQAGLDEKIPVLFQTGLDGSIISLSAKLEATGQDIVFKKEDPAITLSESELQPYTGIFSLGPQTITISVRDKNHLWASIPGQPDYELVPSGAAGKHEFRLRQLEGFRVRFDQEEKGKMQAAFFVQPNGTFKAIRKN